MPHDGQKRASLPCSAPQRGQDRHAGLAQLGDRPRVVDDLLERAQLVVDGAQRGELGRDEVVVAAVEAVQVEDEAAEVAEAELADAAQVAQAAAQPAAVAEARLARRRAPGRRAARSRAGSAAGCAVVGASAVADGPGAGSGLGSAERRRRRCSGPFMRNRRPCGAPAGKLAPRRGVDHAPGHGRRGPPQRRAAALDARVGGGEVRRQRGAPRGRGRTARTACPSMPASAARVDADRRGEHRHVAGERLEHGEAEALVLGGHEHGVGGVDLQRDLVGCTRPSVIRRASPAASRARSKRLTGRVRVGGEEQDGLVGREPEARARLGAGDRREALEVDAAGQDRDAPAAPVAGLGGERPLTAATRSQTAARRGVIRRERGWRRSVPWSVTTWAQAAQRERRPGGQAEVRVDDVEAAARWRRRRSRAARR